MKSLSAVIAIGGVAFAVGMARAQDVHYQGIPMKPDPPPAIDGRLDEWALVPNALTINTKEQAVYGGTAWKSPQDLSAKVWLAWRNENLYLAADVTDDKHSQHSQGEGMWQGDHITFYLDVAPDLDAARPRFGSGQVQFGFSPGSLTHTGDPMNDKSPEAVSFHPQGGDAKGVIVAAQKTPTGYALEAAIPWAVIARLSGQNIERPASGMPLGIEVGISDTDGAETKQEKMMTLLTAPWQAQVRSRLMPAVLAPTDGVAPPVVRSTPIFETLEIPPNEKREIRFTAPATPAGKDAVLSLKARLQYPTVAGYNSGLYLTLNGTPVAGKRLLNRELVGQMASGGSQPSYSDDAFTVPYAPSFEAADTDPQYALQDTRASQFEIRVTDLLKTGENVLTIESRPRGNITNNLVAADGGLQFRLPAIPRVRRPAPTGPLPLLAPQTRNKVNYSVTPAKNGTFDLKVGDNVYQVASQFSTPDGKWNTGSNTFFKVQRKVEKRDEAILVSDTFTNLTQENLPIMQQHRVNTGEKLQKVWLAGLSPSTVTGTSSRPDNPTAYGAMGKAGIGVMALNDEMQVHVTNFTGENVVGISDNQFVLKPGATYTAEWAILPTTTPDYYSFLNAARRLRDCNFAIDGSFAFLRADPRQVTDKWTDQQFADFIRFKNAKFVCDGYTYPNYNGLFPHGTAFQTLDWTYIKAQIARLRKVVPEAKHLAYFHCFIDVLKDADKKYPEARQLRPDGQQTDYGDADNKIFVPTSTNNFGRDMTKNVDIILGKQPEGFGCDGVYWDEFEYSSSQYHYDDFDHPKSGLPWDGVSADIDPETKKISRLKSSVALISQPYRLNLVKRILDHGPLVANGQPFTRTMVQMHFPRFVETGSISNCATAQIFSPIALGDHLTERSEVDAYRWMLRALNFGCLYYWYNDLTVIPSYPTLTTYMFPTTPVELHEGYIIGKERIITNRSGLFGWGDKSKHEVHVFNESGREVTGFKAPYVIKDGRAYSELRLPEDWSAAIVRVAK